MHDEPNNKQLWIDYVSADYERQQQREKIKDALGAIVIAVCLTVFCIAILL